MRTIALSVTIAFIAICVVFAAQQKTVAGKLYLIGCENENKACCRCKVTTNAELYQYLDCVCVQHPVRADQIEFVSIDYYKNRKEADTVMKRYDITNTPAVLLVDAKGKEVYRMKKEIKYDELEKVLDGLIASVKKK